MIKKNKQARSFKFTDEGDPIFFIHNLDEGIDFVQIKSNVIITNPEVVSKFEDTKTISRITFTNGKCIDFPGDKKIHKLENGDIVVTDESNLFWEVNRMIETQIMNLNILKQQYNNQYNKMKKLQRK